jgi:NTE family protein
MVETHRALILQGGGALGAYEAGAVQKLIEKLPELPGNRPIFDIVAGTSSGAINAALLVNHVSKSLKQDAEAWDDAAKELVKFWTDSSINTDSDIELYLHSWKEQHEPFKTAASEEAARRYYSAKHLVQEGREGVFSKPEWVPDERFFDDGPTFPNNLWYRSDNSGLGQKIKNFFGTIKTAPPQPRLLLVATSMKDGAIAVFDSYSTKPDGGGQPHKEESAKGYGKRSLRYTDGVQPEHVIASACVPLFYKPEEIDREKFYDGGILSNTPLREVLHAHRDYWHKIRKVEEVPALEVYIVSVWPHPKGSANGVPEDIDGLRERLYDIQLSDKTVHDEKNAVIVSDLELVNRVKGAALEILGDDNVKKDAFKARYDGLLADKGQSRDRDGKQRDYKSLISGRVKLSQDVVRIECRSDADSISNKLFDLSKKTIDELIKEGGKDAEDALDKAQQKNKNKQ